MQSNDSTHNTAGVAPPAKPEPDKGARLTALIVGSAFFMVLLDGAIIATSLPTMAQSFGVSTVDLSIGISIYILAVATFVPLSAWVSDRFGARRVFLSAMVVFTLASIACAMASTLTEFVLARAVQGAGGAFMTPVGRILVLRRAKKSELIQAMAWITWPALIAPVVGPVLGGFITTYFSWRWNFFINLPLGVIAFALAWWFIPRQAPVARRAFDLPGFFLSSGALLCLLYGLESFAHRNIPLMASSLLVVIGGVLAVGAVRHLRRTEEPLLNLRSFAIKTFSLSTLWVGTCIRTGINSTPFLLPLFFQVAFGLTPLESGGYILVYFLGNLGMKTVTTGALRLFGFRTVLIINGVICGLSIVSFALFSQETAQVVLMVALFVAGLTRSMQYTALNTLAFADIPDQQRSSASTLASMAQQVSMVLGVALSAIMLSSSQFLAQRDDLLLFDFKVAFIAMGTLVLLASLAFISLPRSAGVEVTGHDRTLSLRKKLKGHV